MAPAAGDYRSLNFKRASLAGALLRTAQRFAAPAGGILPSSNRNRRHPCQRVRRLK